MNVLDFPVNTVVLTPPPNTSVLLIIFALVRVLTCLVSGVLCVVRRILLAHLLIRRPLERLTILARVAVLAVPPTAVLVRVLLHVLAFVLVPELVHESANASISTSASASPGTRASIGPLEGPPIFGGRMGGCNIRSLVVVVVVVFAEVVVVVVVVVAAVALEVVAVVVVVRSRLSRRSSRGRRSRRSRRSSSTWGHSATGVHMVVRLLIHELVRVLIVVLVHALGAVLPMIVV